MKYKAKVPYEDSWGDTHYITQRLPWAELTETQKRRKIYKGVVWAGIVAIAGLSAGKPADKLPEEQIANSTRQSVIDFYKTRTDEYKYAMSFLGYYPVADIPTATGGQKLLGMVTRRSISVFVGQTCLEGRAYDTRPSQIRGKANGDISAVASFDATPTSLDVHPAGSNARGLSFTKTSNTLIPTPESVSTLGTYGCVTGLVLWDGEPPYGGKQIQVIPFEEIAKTN
jgi:hypothetical protein